jgi:hypothetical protein
MKHLSHEIFRLPDCFGLLLLTIFAQSTIKNLNKDLILQIISSITRNHPTVRDSSKSRSVLINLKKSIAAIHPTKDVKVKQFQCCVDLAGNLSLKFCNEEMNAESQSTLTNSMSFHDSKTDISY